MRTRLSVLSELLKQADVNRAALLAGAMIIANVIGLVISVIFARIVDDYGSLAALISYLVILQVVGQAIQVATARDGVLGKLGSGEELLGTLERWSKPMLAFTVLATVVSFIARQPIADLVGAKHDVWAAGFGIPAGCVYLWLAILRGILQGVGDYRTVGVSLVGEAGGRLVFGTVLAEAGLGLTGAYAGSLIAYVAMAGYCTVRLYGRLAGPTYRRWRLNGRFPGAVGLWVHVRASAVPIAALAIITLLQNLDLIVSKHRFAENVASSYAAVAVAAKVLIWVAMGASFYLVPETSRRSARHEDPRPVLFRALGIILVCAVPCLLIYVGAAHPLISIVFGKNKAIASSSLVPLGAAFAVLACTYLAVQYLLALKRIWFMAPLAVVAVIEPFALYAAPLRPATFAVVVLAVQIAGAVIAYGIALGTRVTAERPAAEAP